MLKVSSSFQMGSSKKEKKEITLGEIIQILTIKYRKVHFYVKTAITNVTCSLLVTNI